VWDISASLPEKFNKAPYSGVRQKGIFQHFFKGTFLRLLRRYYSSQRKWGEGGQVTTSTKVEYLRPSASGNLTLQKDDFPAKEVRDYEWMLKRGWQRWIRLPDPD
jgi:hypothetical protein